MLGMFWIALEPSIPKKKGFNIMLSLTVKKVDVFKFDGVAGSDNTGLDLNDVVLFLRFTGDRESSVTLNLPTGTILMSVPAWPVRYLYLGMGIFCLSKITNMSW